MPTAGASSVTALTSAPVAGGREGRGIPKRLGEFFLDGDDRLRLLQPLGQRERCRARAPRRGAPAARGAAAGRPRFLGVKRGQTPLPPAGDARSSGARSTGPPAAAAPPPRPGPRSPRPCRRTCSLYSAVNRRRAARAVTSGSAGSAGGRTRTAVALLLTLVALGTSGTASLRTALARRGCFAFFEIAMTEHLPPPSYSNSRGGRCLTIVGIEGALMVPILGEAA